MKISVCAPLNIENISSERKSFSLALHFLSTKEHILIQLKSWSQHRPPAKAINCSSSYGDHAQKVRRLQKGLKFYLPVRVIAHLITCKWNLHTTNIKLLLSMLLLLLLLLIILFVIAISSRTSSSDDNDGKMCHFLPCLSRLYIMFIISISIKLHRMVELIQLCLFLHCTTMKCSPCRQEKICGSRLI